ncbi:hypothetical protein [Klebsiella phage vB_KpnS_IME279]|uniref:Uncharacterized protein n=1 Tax=Klebsiella phage vB_KpnS_IME279 TaxID=2041211 RepID=A0A291LBB7_9CAUD|nr:hypothetical protein HOS15_gp32 [Klebsiella phage vB_KpnS_IME279]ATI16426.1 hypothetical protein [Klebsiella phage vB_KpnS_IME279]
MIGLRQTPEDYGAALMRAWGVPEWPENDVCTYWLWGECGIFAINANEEGGLDGHMAMRPGFRKYVREALADFMAKFGSVPIRAPILPGHEGVRNCLRRFGFVESDPQQVELITGQKVQMIFMRRPPNGRNC